MEIQRDSSSRDLALSLGDFLGDSKKGGIPNTVSEDTVIYIVAGVRFTARFLNTGYCDVSFDRKEEDPTKMKIPYKKSGNADWKIFIKRAYSLAS